MSPSWKSFAPLVAVPALTACVIANAEQPTRTIAAASARLAANDWSRPQSQAAGRVAAETPASRMFERIKALAGDWVGTYKWTGGRDGGGTIRITYTVTGAGSAVIETFTQNGIQSMSTVYHLDGADLRMTHYCGARNQPRLRANRLDEATGAIDFAFVDITNMGPDNEAHVAGMRLRLGNPSQLVLEFDFDGPTGLAGLEHIVVTRGTSSLMDL